MATIRAAGGGGLPDEVPLSDAQAGNGVSTNVVDRGGGLEAALLEIVTTTGGTPTVTINIEGSADGAGWWNVPYATLAAPQTIAVAALVITTATTNRYHLLPDWAWRFFRLNYSANTNVTITARVWIF